MNLIASLASTAWAVIALVRPEALSGLNDTESDGIFFSRMYAARAIPFGLLVGFLPLWLSGRAVTCILLTAGVVQIADVAIAAGKKQPRMMVGATVGAIAHLLCALAISYEVSRQVNQ